MTTTDTAGAGVAARPAASPGPATSTTGPRAAPARLTVPAPRHAGPRRPVRAARGALAFAALGAVAYGAAALTRPAPPSPPAALAAAGQLGQAAADAAPGLAVPYYQPPPAAAAQLAAPGRIIDTGRNEPDPFLLAAGSEDYLFTSQGNVPHVNVPVRVGRGTGHFGPLTDALPVLPAWAAPGFTWAPDVHRFGRHYVLYFTALVSRPGPAMECVGDAVSDRPAGPYRPAPRPLVCQADQGGTIDPRTFAQPGGPTYLLFKSDDNADGSARPTNIYSQRLRGDGEALVGRPTRIFGPDEPWQGTIVEAPDLVAVDGTYWLFYSGNGFWSPDYAMGAARCAGPLGPCADLGDQPLLASNRQGQGPGEEGVFTDARGVWLVYDPFDAGPGNVANRPVAMARLGFGPSGPYLAAPVTAG